jgi:Nbl1 / Borealin N terminal
VENEKRRFEAYLQDILESFATRYEGEITRIPKEIRNMTLREFDKYGGTVPACVQALCKQRIAAGEEMGLERKRYDLLLVSSSIFDSCGRLRKWQVAIQEGANQEEARHAKNRTCFNHKHHYTDASDHFHSSHCSAITSKAQYQACNQ